MNGLVLVMGATGYVGERLWRRQAGLASRVAATTKVVEGDVLKAQTLRRALAGVEVAYYLIHSLGSGRDFEEQDRVAACNFGSAAPTAPCDDSRAVSDAEAVEPMARS